jgi:uncharacterized protein (TIGR02231 family)
MKQALFALLALSPFVGWPAFGSSPSTVAAEPAAAFVLPANTLEDPGVIASAIEAVTVYPGQAMITRKGQALGRGSFVFAGLPSSLQPDSVRLKGEGMEVMGVEVRDRWVAAVADERLAAVGVELKRLGRELVALQDDRGSLVEMEAHYTKLLSPSKSSPAKGGDGAPDPGAWLQSATFLGEKLSGTRRKLRQVGWAIDDKKAEILALDLERNQAHQGSGHQVFDVYVELDAPGPGEVTLEYIVYGAGWTPVYDLRAGGNLDQVELTYRAEVLQQTGEDWNEVDLALSTSEPEFGAQAPELAAYWLSLRNPYAPREMSRGGLVSSSAGVANDSMALDKDFKAVINNLYDSNFNPAAFYASVQSTGASLRYAITRPETIPSRPGTSRVLVGRSAMDVEPEHYCVPSLDEKVWLRGMTTNTSPWVMLPGQASVYFGGDYVGLAQIGNVRLGEEFPLHLGVDPALSVERITLEKKVSTSGFFGSRTSVTNGWRIRFENAGAVGAKPDGSVDVIVRESLPRSNDDRLEIEVDLVLPALSKDERWQQDREEKGFLTWVFNVPGKSEASIEWRSKMTFPEELVLQD